MLSWGRHYLVCPPSHFGVLYEINPWMHREIRVDPDRAQEQWENMVANLEAAGAVTKTMDPVPGLPDLVFTANAGVVVKNTFYSARFRHSERARESPVFDAWFAAHEFEVKHLPEGMYHEGAGDALPFVFGDMGIGHITQCPEHKAVVAFGWACH